MLDKPLTQTSISERIWQLHDTDLEAFKREVRAYVSLCYKGFTVHSYNYSKRIIWLKDER